MATKYNNSYDAPDNNKNLYNAMEAIKRITGYKDAWHNADVNGDKNTANEAAKKAQTYYKMLADSGYSDVANALKNTNNVGAKQIYDNFMKNNSAPTTTTTPTTTPTDTSTGVNSPKSSMPETPADVSTITGKINDLWGIQRSDRETMAGKYDTLEDYNYNHNHYESEIGKSIMEDYKFKGKTASENAVASGGASNGGNIDSYAAANANRQQLAFTNAGKQAVLEDFNTRINNARGILNDLGVYQQNQDVGMQTTINQQQTEEQRVFENEETSRNNQVDRDVKTSEVTGYVPDSMVSANNPFFDKDGTLINPDTTDYSQIITNARNKLKTVTDSAERANLESTIKYATQARAYKILNIPKYNKWANTMELTSPNETFTSKATNKQLDNEKAIADNELNTTEKLTQMEIEANERINNSKNATDLAIADRELEAALAEAESDNYAAYNVFLSMWPAGETDKREFIETFIKPVYEGKEVVTPESLKHLILSNTEKYNIDVDDAQKICQAFGFSTDWLNSYRDRTNDDGYTSEGREGRYGGMVVK